MYILETYHTQRECPMDNPLAPQTPSPLTRSNAHDATNPALVYLASLTSETSRRTMHNALQRIALLVTSDQCDLYTLNWAALRFQHTQAIRSRLAEEYKPATVNKMLSALRGTLEAAWRLEQIMAEDYHRAASVKSIKDETLPTGREIKAGELSALIETCIAEDNPSGIKDAAIIALLYAGGLRRSEVVELNLSDYDQETGRLIVRGKGRKERIVWVTNGAADALAAWLQIRGKDSGAMFVPVNKGGNLKTARLTDQSVYKMLKKRAEQASVKNLSPHDFRRTFVGDLLEAGADISTVSKMAGHANVQTTMRYDRRSEESKKRAAGKLYVPYNQ